MRNTCIIFNSICTIFEFFITFFLIQFLSESFSFSWKNFLFKKYFIYLFLERGEGRERGRETSMCGCLLCAPYWGPGQQPRHVRWLGIKLSDLLVCRPALNPPSHSSQGWKIFFDIFYSMGLLLINVLNFVCFFNNSLFHLHSLFFILHSLFRINKYHIFWV